MISGFFGFLLRNIFILVSNYPLAIILLTVLVKFVLLPLSVSQFKYSKRMSAIQPKMKELQEKYKNDKEKLNIKVMEMYKEHKVNPFTGCLPSLIQLPILIALFNTLRDPMKTVFNGFNELGAQALGQHFFWISDLSKPDNITNVIHVTGVLANIPGILPILAAVTTYLQMASMNKQSGSQANDQMKMMAQIMPVMILFMSYSMPAGLMIYWTVSNIFQLVQQVITGFISKRAEAQLAK